MVYATSSDTSVNEPMRLVAGDSPKSSEIPAWVTACVRFMPPQRNGKDAAAADKVLTAVHYFMAALVPVHGDLALIPNRQRLALWCGYERFDKVAWVLNYLVEIGFLRIFDGGVDEIGRRKPRRDPKTGQPIPNEYVVYTEPPRHYRGPRTFAELDALITSDIEEAVDKDRAAGRNGRPRSVQLRRRELFGVSAGQTEPPRGGQPSPTAESSGVSAGQTEPPRGGRLKEGKREGEKDPTGPSRLTEGATAGPATPSAAPQESAVADEVRELVRRLPWDHYGHDLRRKEAVQVGLAIQAAMDSCGLTLDEAREHALHALAVSPERKVQKLAGWVAGAFREENLLEPLSDDPFPPLAAPVAAEPEAPLVADPASPVRLSACSTCRTPEGGRRPQRVVPREGGRSAPCPECRPEDHAQYLSRATN
jgi:hypothetical protein